MSLGPGDEPGFDDGFRAFYAASFDALVGAVRRPAGADAEDVAQEALLIAGRRWAEVGELDRPVAWVRKVAVRLARRRAARDRERIRREAQAPLVPPARRGDLDLRAAIAGLPERQSAAIRLHHLEDLPVETVAARLGCTEGAAKVLLLRARRVLAERLSGTSGRWVAEHAWTPDGIARHLIERGAANAVGPILEEDMDGRGGRFELTIRDGTYQLVRDDGLRFDHGASQVIGDLLEMSPYLNPGRERYRRVIDGDRLMLQLVDTNMGPTRGVADAIWCELLLESTSFVNADRRRLRL